MPECIVPPYRSRGGRPETKSAATSATALLPGESTWSEASIIGAPRREHRPPTPSASTHWSVLLPPALEHLVARLRTAEVRPHEADLARLERQRGRRIEGARGLGDRSSLVAGGAVADTRERQVRPQLALLAR